MMARWPLLGSDTMRTLIGPAQAASRTLMARLAPPGEVTAQQLADAIADTARNPNTVDPFPGTFSDPVTKAAHPCRRLLTATA